MISLSSAYERGLIVPSLRLLISGTLTYGCLLYALYGHVSFSASTAGLMYWLPRRYRLFW